MKYPDLFCPPITPPYFPPRFPHHFSARWEKNTIIITHIHKNADCQLARVPTGLEKNAFFSFSPLGNALLRVKCTKILVIGPFRLDTWSLPTGDDRNPP